MTSLRCAARKISDYPASNQMGTAPCNAWPGPSCRSEGLMGPQKAVPVMSKALSSLAHGRTEQTSVARVSARRPEVILLLPTRKNPYVCKSLGRMSRTPAPKSQCTVHVVAKDSASRSRSTQPMFCLPSLGMRPRLKKGMLTRRSGRFTRRAGRAGCRGACSWRTC
jgi:hypothetical protein